MNTLNLACRPAEQNVALPDADIHSKKPFRLILTFASLLFFLPLSAQAAPPPPQTPPPFQTQQQLVTLVAAVPVGQPLTGLILVGSSSSTPFVVPAGKMLVLTDFMFTPQVFGGPDTTYALQITPQPPSLVTTQTAVLASTAEPSSFQIHMTTGMMFQAGATVTASLLGGGIPITLYAYGYLMPASG